MTDPIRQYITEDGRHNNGGLTMGRATHHTDDRTVNAIRQYIDTHIPENHRQGDGCWDAAERAMDNVLTFDQLTTVLYDWMPDGGDVAVGFEGEEAHLTGSDLARFIFAMHREHYAKVSP